MIYVGQPLQKRENSIHHQNSTYVRYILSLKLNFKIQSKTSQVYHIDVDQRRIHIPAKKYHEVSMAATVSETTSKGIRLTVSFKTPVVPFL